MPRSSRNDHRMPKIRPEGASTCENIVKTAFLTLFQAFSNRNSENDVKASLSTKNCEILSCGYNPHDPSLDPPLTSTSLLEVSTDSRVDDGFFCFIPNDEKHILTNFSSLTVAE